MEEIAKSYNTGYEFIRENPIQNGIDAGANNLIIDCFYESGVDLVSRKHCTLLGDDGYGTDYDGLLKIISFGLSSKNLDQTTEEEIEELKNKSNFLKLIGNKGLGTSGIYTAFMGIIGTRKNRKTYIAKVTKEVLYGNEEPIIEGPFEETLEELFGVNYEGVSFETGTIMLCYDLPIFKANNISNREMKTIFCIKRI